MKAKWRGGGMKLSSFLRGEQKILSRLLGGTENFHESQSNSRTPLAAVVKMILLLCQHFEISMYFTKFPFALQTIFPLHSLEADNSFQPATVCDEFFLRKGNAPLLPDKNNGRSLNQTQMWG